MALDVVCQALLTLEGTVTVLPVAPERLDVCNRKRMIQPETTPHHNSSCAKPEQWVSKEELDAKCPKKLVGCFSHYE